MFTKIMTLLSLIATLGGAPVQNHSIYMRGMEIVNLDYNTDIVTCVDAAGFEWEFTGCEDYCVNDIVCVLLDTMGTEDTIKDDVILKVDYSGYWTD